MTVKLRIALRIKGLTPRESEVVGYLIHTLTNKEIGLKMGIVAQSVKSHLNRVYKKLKLKSRAQTIIWCSENGGI